LAQLQRLVIPPHQLSDRQITLTPEQQHYLLRVLRLNPNDRFIALTGSGQTWLAQLDPAAEPTANQTAQLTAHLVEPIGTHTELPIPVTLALALPKTGFDDVVRQVTELGVTTIVPILSERTLLNPSPNKLERWRRIATEAAEQSERQVVPTIGVPIGWSTYLTQPGPSLQLLCWERGSATHLSAHLSAHLDKCVLQQQIGGSIGLAIGPEGGWTPNEVDAALAAGYQAVSLGPRILRAVTAPLAALAMIAAHFESQPDAFNQPASTLESRQDQPCLPPPMTASNKSPKP
jgi:16S rRNA (uracil1498-N3)-methyltransferase